MIRRLILSVAGLLFGVVGMVQAATSQVRQPGDFNLAPAYQHKPVETIIAFLGLGG